MSIKTKAGRSFFFHAYTSLFQTWETPIRKRLKFVSSNLDTVFKYHPKMSHLSTLRAKRGVKIGFTNVIETTINVARFACSVVKSETFSCNFQPLWSNWLSCKMRSKSYSDLIPSVALILLITMRFFLEGNRWKSDCKMTPNSRNFLRSLSKAEVTPSSIKSKRIRQVCSLSINCFRHDLLGKPSASAAYVA